MVIAECNFMDKYGIYSPIFLAKMLIKVIILFFFFKRFDSQKSESKYLTEFREARLIVELWIRPWQLKENHNHNDVITDVLT